MTSFQTQFQNMAAAGYSGTPLAKKLGIKPEMKILLLNAPSNYEQLLEQNIKKQLCKTSESPDLVHLFSASQKEFETQMKTVLPMTKKNSSISIWVSWYKKAAGIKTDLTEDIIRNFALKNGLVDLKVCAVSDVWSGLKLVVPLNKR